MKQIDFDDNGALVCPACGGNNLSHTYVDVWVRNEDASTAMCIGVCAGSGVVEPSFEPAENCPSARRGAVSVHFLCESCGDTSELHVVQHKGQTYLSLLSTTATGTQ